MAATSLRRIEPIPPLEAHIRQICDTPEDALSWVRLSQALLAEQDSDLALQAAERSVLLNQQDASVISFAGQLNLRAQRFSRALELLLQAHAMHPEQISTARSLRDALQMNGHLEAARELARMIANSNLGDGKDHYKLAALARLHGDLDAAESMARSTMERWPAMRIDCLELLRYTLKDKGDLEAERRCIDELLTEPRAHSKAEIFNADWNIHQSDYPAAVRGLHFMAHSCMPKLATVLPPDAAPLTIETLEPNDGQNFSQDTLMSRYLLTLPRNRNITVRTHPRITELFARSMPWIRFVPYNTLPSPEDLAAPACHLMSLPHIMEFKSPPREVTLRAHLKVDPVLRKRFRTRYLAQSSGRFLIGVNWRGGLAKQFKNIPLRNLVERLGLLGPKFFAAQSMLWRKCVNLEDWTSLFRLSWACPVAIQYGIDDWEREQLRSDARFSHMIVDDEVDYFGDLDVVAAQIAALDCVVTTNNTHAHLAAAAGVPTFILYQATSQPLWSFHKNFPHYPDVTLLEKPVQRRPDGRYDRQYHGNWAPTIEDGVRQITERFGPD